MHSLKRFSGIVILALLMVILAAGYPATVPVFVNEVTVAKDAGFILTLYGFPPEEVEVSGTMTIGYSDVYPAPDNHMTIDYELLGMELTGTGIVIRNNPDVASYGSSRSLEEWIDFPAESFFDIMYELEIPGVFPGDTLLTYEPMHLAGIIDGWPPYGSLYEMANPVIIVYNEGGLAVGEITLWSEVNHPLSEPEALVILDTEYGSEVAQEYGEDVIEVRAAIGVPDADVVGAQFLFRESGEGPFLPFWTDYEGAGGNYGTVSIMENGDGWAGYLDISALSTLGGYYDVMVDFEVAGWGHYMDTALVYLDPTPPVPVFSGVDPDSVIYFHADSCFDITFSVEDELGTAGFSAFRVFPLAPDYSRDLVAIDQNNLGTDFDDWACTPTATASCLKYFADHGHGNLDNPGGDEAQDESTPDEMAEELVGDMKTDSSGTDPDNAVAGINKYLGDHGENADDWEVEHEDVENYEDIGEMLREFEADSEDVIILLADTNSAGDTLGHAGTLGSKNSEYYEEHQGEGLVGQVGYTLDFMDPNGGGSTEDNEYGVGENDAGRPTLEGYSFTDSTEGCAWIEGYIKVSPPAGGGKSSSGKGSVNRRLEKAPSSTGWINVSSGTVTGDGEVDTLQWDTTGFPGGLYMIEIVTVDDEGIQCRDLRLGGIPEYTVGVNPDIPGTGTMLRRSYPNPFNPSTTIEFYISEKTFVTMTIYDISGRRLRRLLDAKNYDAGLHKTQWDGRDDSGNRLASGVYFCRFEAGEKISSRKLILLR